MQSNLIPSAPMRLPTPLVVLLVIGATACGDDLSVVVDVTHPGPVAKTVISVYESESVDCTKIEFGDLDENALEATRGAEEIHDATGVTGDLDGISRTEDKAIVARGYNDDDELIAAGCKMKGVVKGRDHVAIDTVPAMVISAVSDSADPYTLTVLGTKPDGGLLAKREVSWQVYAPVGSTPLNASLATISGDAEWQPIKNGCTNNNGVAKLHPVPPSVIGGFATRIRGSWAANTLPLESALSRADLTMPVLLRPPATVKHACAVKIAGTMRRLICLDTDASSNPIARELSVSVGSGRGSFTTVGTSALTTTPVGVFAKPAAIKGDQDVYVVDTAGDQKALFGAPVAAQTLCPTCAVTDFLYAPACTGDPDAKLYLQEGTALRVMSATGGATTLLSMFTDAGLVGFTLKSAGCVNQMTPQSSKLDRQVAVIDVTVVDNGAMLTLTRGFYNCDQAGCNKLLLPVAGAGVGFATTATGEHRLVGASLDATGLVISSWIIRPTFDTATRIDLLLERDRLPAAGIPHELVIDTLDDDAGDDMVWDIASPRGTTLELAYSRMAGTQRLEVVAPITNLATEDLQLADLSGDGHPELIMVGVIGSGPAGTTPVTAIPTHVAPAATATVGEECR
ncbi:hypothetical protein BH11MYX3_BH11MYX3_35600 [soil metagenome]